MHKFLSDNTVPSIRKIDGVFTKLMMQVVMIILTKIMFLRQISDKKKKKKEKQISIVMEMVHDNFFNNRRNVTVLN